MLPNSPSPKPARLPAIPSSTSSSTTSGQTANPITDSRFPSPGPRLPPTDPRIPSASAPASRRGSIAQRITSPLAATSVTTSSSPTNSQPPLAPSAPQISPRTILRPRIDRAATTNGLNLSAAAALLAETHASDPFHEGATITVNQPVGSLSISPSSRDVCLASRKGLYILDLANLESAPRFVPQGGTWQIADVQWSPHAATDNLILSTSSQKLLVWDLAANVPLNRSIDAHDRAITDINWHPLNPNVMGTTGMDAAIRGWDLRTDCHRPTVRLSAWGAAGTQFKWNRKNEYLLATAHHREVLVWDCRKGSMPVVELQAHDSKIYGIDWDRLEEHKLVTCSLDKTIKYWSLPTLSGGKDTEEEPHAKTISTTYPVWRARNLPFGSGVLALPQRGETALEMFGTDADSLPLERFEGSTDVVKEFVWRIRGGADPTHDDRDFQLVTWSKDRKLRIWPITREISMKAGFKPGAPVPYRSPRLGAKNRTFTLIPGGEGAPPTVPTLEAPTFTVGVPSGLSGISRQRIMAPHKREAGMTRGGSKRTRELDQLEWLARVVKIGPGQSDSTPGTRTPSNSDSSRSRSRSQSVTSRPLASSGRTPSRVRASLDSESTSPELMPLKDEVLLIHKRFPKSKVNYEKFDLSQRKLTMSMNGPWANGDRYAFIRIHWSFPPNYPFGLEAPTFELERNATVSPITRHRMVSTIKEMRAAHRQCLIATTEFLLGYHERTGRRMIEEESGSDSDDEAQNVPMLVRTTGAVFGPGGQLVCFFPKQTALPRAKTSLSRSPSGSQDASNPLAKAISALSRLGNPNKPTVSTRYHRHVKRLRAMLAPVQQRSVLTLHNVSHLVNEPDVALAAAYSTSSCEANLVASLDAKKLDHAEVWATLRAVLMDPPPPYADHPPLRHDLSARRERRLWERDLVRKRRVIDELFDRLMDSADVQLLALVACVLLDYERNTPAPPPPMEPLVARSPEQGYFHLPPHHHVPAHRSSSITTPTTPPVQSGPSSFRTSGWSQILMNPSSISLRGMALTPRDRPSFEMPRVRTPQASSFEDANAPPSPNRAGSSIPKATRHDSINSQMGSSFSRTADRRDSEQRLSRIPGRPLSGTTWSPPHTAVPPTPSRLGEPSSIETPGIRHKVSFGSGSPLRRAFSRAPNLPPLRRTPTCSVRIDLSANEDPPPSLLRAELLPLAEVWKLVYADVLLRQGLVGKRAQLLQYEFCPSPATSAASGELQNQSLVFASVCRFCNERVIPPNLESCPGCRRAREPPHCSVCRLPIKGLATTCTVCSHTSHVRCLRAVLTATDAPCPACACRCLAERGVSGEFRTREKAGDEEGSESPSRLLFDGPPEWGWGTGALDLAGVKDEPVPKREGLLARSKLRALGTEGILGW